MQRDTYSLLYVIQHVLLHYNYVRLYYILFFDQIIIYNQPVARARPSITVFRTSYLLKTINALIYYTTLNVRKYGQTRLKTCLINITRVQ